MSTNRTIILSAQKNAQELLVKTATNCIFVRLLVAQNGKVKKRNYDPGKKNSLKKEAVDGKDGTMHGSI